MYKFNKKRIFILPLALLIIPSLGFLSRQEQPQKDINSSLATDQPSNLHLSKTVKIDFEGEVKEISLLEYLKGVVSAEMPISFHEEALKAQIIAAHTYAFNRYGYDGVYPTDPSVFQAYNDQNKRKQKYKDNFEQTEYKLENIVEEVANKIIVYDDKPIVATFFSMSGGTTENCSQVFGGDYPYLTATDSSHETTLPNFITEVKIDTQTLKTTLQNNIDNLNLDDNILDDISILEHDQSNYVSLVGIKDKQLSGVKFRNIFKLPSADFTISKQDDGLVFSCKGKGHGVGMSQYGANELAKTGKDYESILKYYYKDTSLKSIHN